MGKRSVHKENIQRLSRLMHCNTMLTYNADEGRNIAVTLFISASRGLLNRIFDLVTCQSRIVMNYFATVPKGHHHNIVRKEENVIGQVTRGCTQIPRGEQRTRCVIDPQTVLNLHEPNPATLVHGDV